MIEKLKLKDIYPYERNPRHNDAAVEAVAESIRQCGYIAPIIVDEDHIILAGHTRYKALKQLGYKEADVLVKTGMTEEQKKKYRLLDNKTNEFAGWDIEMLQTELEDIDFEGFDFRFDIADVDWDDVEELDDNSYEAPEYDKLECPKCGHIDRKIHFKAVKEE